MLNKDILGDRDNEYEICLFIFKSSKGQITRHPKIPV